ncbi:MAG: Pr6Pr family membrane protein [Cyanobacteria bacterium J06638_6]
MPTSLTMRRFARLAALLAWLTIGLRFYLSVRTGIEDGTGVAGGIVSFFSYFTVLTNILVAVGLTAGSLHPKDGRSQNPTVRFFQRPGVVSAIAVYITVVGIIYHLLLSSIWDPQGLAKFLNIMLHYVMPVLFVAYWWFGVPKQNLRWGQILPWLSYPVGYLLYSLVLGALRDQYPYPFADVNALGYAQVLKNSVGVLLFFGLISIGYMALGRWQSQRLSKRASNY